MSVMRLACELEQRKNGCNVAAPRRSCDSLSAEDTSIE